MTLLLIWALLSAPYDRLVCSMWVSNPPTQAAMASAGCAWTPDQAAGYVWRAVEIGTGKVFCERPAAELPTIACELKPLDHYLLRVYQPGYVKQYCTATTTGAPPTEQETAQQCPPGALEAARSGAAAWKQVSSYMDGGQAQAGSVATCPLPELSPQDVPASVQALATNKDYFLLDYELNWWYGPSYSAADWQNQYDAYIWDNGLLQRVPPRLLKGILGQESQFWPLWTPERGNAGEVGLGQLTDDGADLALHYSAGLYNQYCPFASLDCWKGYELQPYAVRQMLRDILRGRLVVTGTPRQAALQAAYTIPAWAQILAAYYCAAGEIVRQAGAAPSWDFAAAAYHSGLECVRGGEICQAGKDYLVEVKR